MQNLHNLELAWLKDCIALAEKRNFSQAAAMRYVTQSAFSRRIQSLEEWVGTPLFTRNRRGVQLTKAGEAFCTKVPELLRMLDEARGEALDIAGNNSPDIIIAATHSLSFSFFPELLRTNSNIARFGSFRLLSDTLQICERILMQGEAQFLLAHYHPLMHSNLETDKFTSIVIGRDRLLPYSRKTPDSHKPLWKIDSEGEIPYLSFSNESGIGRILANMLTNNKIQKQMKSVFTADLAAALLAMVKAGDGVAWLPETLAEQEMKNGNIVVATEDQTFWLPIEIRLYRPSTSMTPSAEILWQIFSQHRQ